MKSMLLIAVALSTLFLTGCPNRPKVKFDNNFVSQINQHLAEQQIRYECSARKHTYTVSSAGTTCNEASTFEGGPEEARRIRNDVIEDAVAILDDNYTDFITNIETRRARTDFIADVIELGTAATIGITKGERPIQILGVALTAFRGGRRSSELNFYKQQTTPILITKMDDGRSRVLVTILSKQSSSINEYSMKAAIRDVVNYYNAGTLIRAFTELSKDASVQAKVSENAVRVLRGDVEITDIPTLEETQVTGSIFTQRRSLEDQVDAAIAAADKAAEAIPIPTPVAATASDTEKQANTAAIDAAKANRNNKRAEKLKPIRDKFETILREVVAQPALASAVAEMKDSGEYKDILAKRDATPPQQLTEDDYLDLLAGLTARIQRNPEARKQLQIILSRVNK